MQTTCAFDATRPVAIVLRTPDGPKTIRVRFPYDQEWTERQRRRKVIIKQLGRGISETTVANSEDVDAALLAKTRTEEEPAVDPFEASRVVEQLALAEVDDVVSAGDAFRVTLRVLGGTTTHLLRMPSAKDVIDYRRGFARVLDLPFNKQELTINARAAGDLYKKLVEATEGYVGDVPIIHQMAAVKAAIDALDATFHLFGPRRFRSRSGRLHRFRPSRVAPRMRVKGARVIASKYRQGASNSNDQGRLDRCGFQQAGDAPN